MSHSTPQQHAAIVARGNTLLVAGAGTGKTTTLVQRCLQLVLEEGVSIDRILMVTFTDAAAAEMRHRIRAALQKKLADTPDNERLAEQLALLDTAFISTLHSFCMRLIREHFHELQVDPQLTILDEQQTRPLMQEVLEELFQRAYADETPRGIAIRDLIQRYGQRTDERVRELIKSLHVFTQTLAQPQKWLAKALEFYNGTGPGMWQSLLGPAGSDWARDWQAAVKAGALDAANLSPVAQALEDLIAEPTEEVLAKALSATLAADADWKRGTKTRCRKPLERFFDEAEFLQSQLTTDGPNPLQLDWEIARGPMVALLELTQEFTESYRLAKRDLGGIDFADLEQLVLKLLLDDNGQPTDTARLWQSRLDHVFVDECQDINAAQDAIIQAVSRPGAEANRFMVGDVKQSIYRFRLANPHIFQNYQHTWAQGQTHHQVLPLTENFRSREGVIDFVNSVFGLLMQPSLGGLHYDETAALQFGAREARAALSRLGDEATPKTGAWAEPSPRTELHLLVEDKSAESADEEWADLLTTEREARIVAHRLRELHDGAHPIWDKNENAFRPVKWSDMAILLRNASGRAESFARACHEAGVPLIAKRSGFFVTIEVLDLVNLLRLLDNPLQDIPLLAVLRSPLVGLSLDELAFIRAGRKEDCFWLALHYWHRNHKEDANETWFVVDRFLQQHAEWRALIRQTSLSCCLDRVLGETNYEAFLLTTERGEERVANVKRLLDLARRYDPYQRQGLFRFLQFVEAQEEVDYDLEPAPPRHPDAVQLMTIHKSKGLEFPVVVLANISGKFNERSLNGDIFWSEDLGLAPRIVLPEGEQRYPSIAHWTVRRREQREAMGEELRLLYVALTRARDTLILSGKGSSKLLDERWGVAGSGSVEFETRKARSFWDWLKLWLREHTNSADWANDLSGGDQLIRWQLHTSGVALVVPAEVMVGHSQSSSSAFSEDLAEQLTWKYPFPAATAETAKTSVTVLRRRRDETDEEAKPLVQYQFQFQLPQPKTEIRTKLSASEVGQAHHTFLQFVDLNETGNVPNLRNEAEQLVADTLLRQEEADALDFEAVASFWNSPVGSSVRSRLTEVHRELPFTARFTVADLAKCGVGGVNPSLPPDEFVVVQGVMDLVVIGPKELWLLDFKTDRLYAEDMPEKLKLYTPQLKLYALALERIYQRPVTKRWLHWLYLRETVEV